MERGRSTGVGGGGGARGLVAGVRKVFRSKSCSEKHSRSRTVREDEAPDQAPGSRATHPPTRNSSSSSSNNTTTKHRRCPRSPFLGWRRSKSHKDISESQKKAKGRDALENERAGWCSQSQAERLSLHSSETYGHITLAAQQDVGTGRCGDSERSRAQSDNKNGTTTNEDESGSDCGEYTEPRLCNGTTVCSDGNGAVGDGGEPCAKTSDGVKDHANNSVINSFVCNSDNVVVGSESSCVSLPESGSGGQPRGVVRDRGDGSDSLEVCGEEETLEKETCVRYLKDIYRNSKETSDCPTSFSGGPAMLGRGLWLKAALSYNLQMPDSPRNEVVVLALGIDQYIEEVFRHLDPSGTSRVNAEDLEALCQVLRLTEAMKEEEEEEVERCRCLGSNLTLHGSLDGSLADINQYSKCPLHLTFSDFNDKLCARFIRAAKAESVLPLGLRRPNNQRLVTSVVNVQRRYDVLENISRSLAEVNAKLNDKEGTRLLDDCTTTGVVCCKCQQVTHVDRNSNISPQPLDVEVSYLQRQVLLQEQELQCLREVIEDMRIALQSSDAENLALHVRIERGDVTPNPRASQHDLSLTDEEDTIDNLVRQLTELDRPAALSTSTDPDATPTPSRPPSPSPAPPPSQRPSSTTHHPENPNSTEDPLNTAFISGDCSMEAELQATYEALQEAREQQEAMQADLQQTVSQLQEREADLRGAELNLRAAHSALEKAHYDNHALVMEIAETRRTLEKSQEKVQEAWEDLRQARDTALLKETQLQEAEAKIQRLRHSR
ncbi:uncharacterized protein LOC121859427 [Homarus americanus]|uniref:uncharacterized protein LOC121859427 n=1 Tax=Homarus americanus TaxID=6706 RepID=UPI001C4733BB|nr:uncharacterized protein LOC121859427 [Homarus americanus]